MSLFRSESQDLILSKKLRLLNVLIGRNAYRSLMGIFFKYILLTDITLSTLLINDINIYIHTICKLQSQSGMRFLIIYLKCASTIMMQKTGGQVIPDLSVFGCRVSRSHHN